MPRLLSLLLLLVLPGFAHAHGIGAQARLSNNSLVVESYYEDDTPVKNARVELRDANDTIIGEGTTDEKGICLFAIPKPGKYRVRVDAGDGHLAKTSITIGEGGGATSDGPTREEYTGNMRYVMAGVGLLLIGGLTLLAMRASRKTEAK